tara:strand:+ start:4273 stop:4887 length:615 start_codon:yes stop_codon:yes gene_type:complete
LGIIVFAPIRISLFLVLLLAASSLADARGRLPKEIAGFDLQGISIYDEPGLGFSARYWMDEKEQKFDVYLYTAGVADLGSGVNDRVAQEFKSLFVQISEMERLGYYADVTDPQTGSGTINLDGSDVGFLWGRVQFRQTDKGREVTHVESQDIRSSYVFITAYQGRFLKVRYTLLSDDLEAGTDAFMAIMEDFERRFSQPELPLP